MLNNRSHALCQACLELVGLDFKFNVQVLWPIESRQAVIHNKTHVSQLVLVASLLQL